MLLEAATALEQDPETHHPSSSSPAMLNSDEISAAAAKVQKAYRSYRTRRDIVDRDFFSELPSWKKTSDAARDNNRSFPPPSNGEKDGKELVSSWTRILLRLERLGSERVKNFALQHWLETLDPRHRRGLNLRLYYDVWSRGKRTVPFFYWLDVGEGKEVNLDKCPRSKLQRECIRYLGPKEREAYEVIVNNGKLMYRKNGNPVENSDDSNWLFVLSRSKALYVGQEEEGGVFCHASILPRHRTISAGRLVAHGGVLKTVWPQNGGRNFQHLSKVESFKELFRFLDENGADLTEMKVIFHPWLYKMKDNEALIKWAIISVNVLAELCQSISSEEASNGKMKGEDYLRLTTGMSSICLVLVLLEVFREAKESGVKLRYWCYLYYPQGKYERAFGSFALWFGLVSSVIQFSINLAALVTRRAIVKFDYLGLVFSVLCLFAAIGNGKKTMVAVVKCKSHGETEIQGKLCHGSWVFECLECKVQKLV